MLWWTLRVQEKWDWCLDFSFNKDYMKWFSPKLTDITDTTHGVCLRKNDLFVAKNHCKFHEAWQHEGGPSTPKTSLLECPDSRCYKQTDTTNANVWGYKDYTINFLKKGFTGQGEYELICSKCVARTFVFKWNLVVMPTQLVSLDRMPLF